MQIYFLANVSLFLIEVSKKEGFKNCALRQEFCYAITFVLSRKRAAVTGSYTSLLCFPAQGCLVGTVGGGKCKQLPKRKRVR